MQHSGVRPRSVLAAVLVLGALAIATTPSIAASTHPAVEVDETTIDEHPGKTLTQQSTPVQNNSTVRHRNPDEIDSETQLTDLQRVLGERLTERLDGSTVQLSQEQYEQARSILGEEYLEQLAKYGDVADERDDENATAAAETFNETRERQREFVETVRTFQSTYEAYQDARASGDDQAALQRARELQRLNRRASRQATELNEGYGQLENRTSVNLTVARTSVTELQAELATDASAVQTAEFANTTVVIREADETGSFTDPLRVAATLRAEDGPLADQAVRIEVGERTYTVETDGDGEFDLSYRPTLVPVNASSVTVRYVPAATSRYSSANVSLPVELDSTTGSVEIEESTTEAGFGDTVTVSGQLTVAGQGVSDVPLAVVIGPVRLGAAETSAGGSFVYNGSMPAGPAPGSRTLAVDDATDGLALSVDRAMAPVTVRETQTTLSAGAIREGEGVGIVGRLTADGRPVPGQQIVASVAGDRIGIARTADDGAFALRVDETEVDGSVRLAFTGEGTNLADAETTLTIQDPADPGPNTETGSNSPGIVAASGVGQLLTLLGLLGTGLTGKSVGTSTIFDALVAFLATPLGLVTGGFVLGGGGLTMVIVLRWREGAIAAGASEVSAGVLAGEDDGVAGESTTGVTAERFEAIESELAAGRTDAAVLGAYGLVRRALAERLPAERARSHWQFFEACAAAGMDAEALRTLTETYERSRYGAGSVSRSLAAGAVASARRLTDVASGSEASEGSTEPGD